jgi:hypothetical protein
VNRKRVRRLYRLERLQLRMRVRRRAGLRLFSQRLRQPVLVEREVGDKPFQPASFLLPPAGAGAARLRPGGRIFSSTRRKWRHSPRAAGRGHRPGCRRLLSNRDTICSSENFDRFIGSLLSCETAEARILPQFQPAVVFRGDVSPTTPSWSARS